MGAHIHIEKGNLGNAHLGKLAGIVYEAFENKITALRVRKEVALAVLENSFNPDSAFFAYRKSRLVGVAGMVTRNSRFLHFRLKELRKHYNLLRSLFYSLY